MTGDFTYRQAISELSRLLNKDRLNEIRAEGGMVKVVKIQVLQVWLVVFVLVMFSCKYVVYKYLRFVVGC